MSKYIVVTGIHGKTDAIAEYERMHGWTTIVVGDRKSKPITKSSSLIYLSPDDQKKLGYPITEISPWSHYSRKNIGYLFAIKNGAEVIFDTDDDNLPMDNWHQPEFVCKESVVGGKFFNVYSKFTESNVWPRGFPLTEILNPRPNYSTNDTCHIGVCQSLAAGEPDVDAIYRLTSNKPVMFMEDRHLALGKGTYCPFNSQGTFWRKEAFPYLYLPSWVSFRFTDILRGYIAQRLLWEDDLLVSFHSPMVFQDRNTHDLMKDFADEVECHTNISKVVGTLDTINLDDDPLRNLEIVYQLLNRNGLVADAEVETAHCWSWSFLAK